jgi:hypothetical protein
MSIFTNSQIVLQAELRRDQLCILPIDTDVSNIVVVKSLDLNEDDTMINNNNINHNTINYNTNTSNPTKYIFQYNVLGVLETVPVFHCIT